jgi:hypothetical protein
MWPTLLIPLLGKLFDKVIPDPAAASAAKLQILQMSQTGELAQLAADTDLAKAQAAVNQTEAGNASLFVAGWRPFVGWICGSALGFKYIGGPLLVMLTTLAGHPVALPDIGFTDLMPILLGMLGLGGMRTFEKIKGVA